METRPCPGLTLPDEYSRTFIGPYEQMTPPPPEKGLRFVRAEQPVKMPGGQWRHVFVYAPAR